MVLPHLLDKIYKLPLGCLSESTARLLADGKVDEVMQVFGAAWSSRYPISSRDNEVHVFETLISGGIARAFSDLASRHPQVLSLTGSIRNETSGEEDKKRLDLAWTIGDLTYVAEVKIVKKDATEKKITKEISDATKQVSAYGASLAKRRPGKQVLWVVILDRSGSFRRAEVVGETM